MVALARLAIVTMSVTSVVIVAMSVTSAVIVAIIVSSKLCIRTKPTNRLSEPSHRHRGLAHGRYHVVVVVVVVVGHDGNRLTKAHRGHASGHCHATGTMMVRVHG
jgi:MFS superfamily sulfate permease-like transporter